MRPVGGLDVRGSAMGADVQPVSLCRPVLPRHHCAASAGVMRFLLVCDGHEVIRLPCGAAA